MGVIGKDFKYLKVQNFIDENLRKFLFNYCKMRHQIDDNVWLNFDDFTAGDSKHYGDPASESLLLFCQPKMEELVGKKLFPTYSFWRMYTYGGYLKKHTDRPACEISVTMNIQGDTDWPIYVDDKPIHLNPGDGLIYLGCELKHERKKLEGDYQAQIFLHYVDADGPSKEHKFDKRPGLGIRQS
tara:strand:+ start:1861 stop:2412 length:552 start_codon:yes stop_codon:yes gene_type:complete